MFLCSTNHQFQAPSGSWPSAGLTTTASARLAIRRRHMFSAPRFVSDTDDCTHVHQGTSAIYEQPFIFRLRLSAARQRLLELVANTRDYQLTDDVEIAGRDLRERYPRPLGRVDRP